MAEVENDYLREILAATRGNKSEAAKILGISRKNLYERLARKKSEVGAQTSEVGGQRSEVSESENSPVIDASTSDL
jgi:two-component system response regulator HydG